MTRKLNISIIAASFLLFCGLATLCHCAETKDIKVFALLDLTGDNSSLGKSIKAAIDVSAEDFNRSMEESSSEIRVRLIVEDTQTDPESARKKMFELYKQGAKIIIGPCTSAELNSTADDAFRRNVLLISPASTAISFADKDDAVFRLILNDSFQAEVLAQSMKKDSKKFLLQLQREDAWGRELAAAVKSKHEALGGKVLRKITYKTDSVNFSKELEHLEESLKSALKENSPENVAIQLLAFDEAVRILEQADKFPALSGVTWYGSDGTAQLKSLLDNAKAADFAARTGLFSPVVGSEAADKLKGESAERIRKMGGYINGYTLAAYDALWISALSQMLLGNNPELKLEAIKKAVMTTASNYSGMSGRIALDKTGERLYGCYEFWTVVKEQDKFTWKLWRKYQIAPDRVGWNDQL